MVQILVVLMGINEIKGCNDEPGGLVGRENNVLYTTTTHRLMEETDGTLSCEQMPSASNLSLISQANMVGLSLL